MTIHEANIYIKGFAAGLKACQEHITEVWLPHYDEKIFPKPESNADKRLDDLRTNWSGNVMRDMLPRVAKSFDDLLREEP
jgi:hypothetical protein